MTARNLIVILGPTASGKSSLGIALAKRFHGVVISADSRQVYRGMDIGTGKVTKREMSGVRHELLNVASPRRQYTVARYLRDVQRVLRRLPPAVPIFLVGGSPFYIEAITRTGTFSPVPPDPQLRRRLAKKTTPQLIALLRRKDPERLATIDTANRRRLIRAIEIASSSESATSPTLPPFRLLTLGVALPKHTLHQRIDRRVDVRLRQGMVAEVARLHRAGLSWNKLDAFGLEYRFLSRYLRGQLSKPEAIQQLKSAIHHFAKRQMTWWKRDTEVQWLRPPQARAQVKAFLNQKSS